VLQTTNSIRGIQVSCCIYLDSHETESLPIHSYIYIVVGDFWMSDDAWGFTIDKVPIDLSSINASRPLGFVIAQPLFNLDPDSNPHFQILPEFRQTQCDAITSSFAVREAETNTRQIPIPFIVFPEGAIPTKDPDGLEIVASPTFSLGE